MSAADHARCTMAIAVAVMLTGCGNDLDGWDCVCQQHAQVNGLMPMVAGKVTVMVPTRNLVCVQMLCTLAEAKAQAAEAVAP